MKKLLLLCGCLASLGVQADCRYDKTIELTLDLGGSEELSILAGAGYLEISGSRDGNMAMITGRVCVSEEEWLDESTIITESGKQAKIIVELPDQDGGGWFSGNNYAYMDLKIEVPETMALTVRDSSGDIEMNDVGAVTVQDSSGDLDISRAYGSVSIRDSSGDIDLDGIEGDVIIESDSSGDIDGEDIMGMVRVLNDSSGEIHFSRVRDDFIVERDSSGDISADDIGGDFRVERDGSGEIRARNVSGEVDIPSK
jgi:DUF4097 and DUF4098 domain-containing protein YvlB